MRFEPTADQKDFASSLDALISGADPVAAARAWADGDAAPGLALWGRIAEQGVNALLVPEENDGMGASPVELVIAFEVLGRHAVPGPWVESVAYLATELSGEAQAAIAAGTVATGAVPPHTPYALDADVAEQVYVVGSDGVREASVGEQVVSVDRTRRLFTVTAGAVRDSVEHADAAFDLAALACAAQLLGAGERVLADSVAYVKQRKQFGREIGSYQAIKHALADVRIALDFARPLLHGAALEPTPRAVSAAKVACADAAYLASRTGLQVHGAIGYTAEFDLSIWLNRIRALVGAWGTPAFHRARILDSLVGA
ncbi:acyl-CoA/acyl-ACP dehydrogenase [Nocardioides sp. zg-536]|uniref:Acyl-CoA/acyl-ACP dehydrogenase n=1 Tax=Nocardioides faecalis TaxID=2803858 RepID=A0A938Y7E7_9ACTN|nr:acyl-CoA dehydrogenase family protein [Nocardioides faecalis]MBM9458871.1 acyl-CoA/acyl-ACP dehydrogenase [Nocardioides faecalis]MBS4754033.1 acyl-CoA/acyl-ACP dehydrogenase [Nocardioides faecalis]QVI60275.1 acyl-CoA/acyl-ACP dehydrogenase [Nocardioides faecalis]